MSAMSEGEAMKRRGSRSSWRWWGIALVLVGALTYACSNQKEAKGPQNPAAVTGSDAGGTIVTITLNPNSVPVNRRIGITVIVTSIGGQRLEGRHVQLSTEGGRLDRVDGFTDPDGKFISFLLCDQSGTFTITAVVINNNPALGGGAALATAEATAACSGELGGGGGTV